MTFEWLTVITQLKILNTDPVKVNIRQRGYPHVLMNHVLCRFLNSIQLFLQLDSGTPQGMAQQVTNKVTQHLTGASYGENVKLLNSVIQVLYRDPSCTGKHIVSYMQLYIDTDFKI